VRSETSFLGVSRLQDVATTTTSAAGRDHRAGRSALALGMRIDAEWLLKHFMIAKAINCPRKRGNSTIARRYAYEAAALDIKPFVYGRCYPQKLWITLWKKIA